MFCLFKLFKQAAVINYVKLSVLLAVLLLC